MSVLSLIPEDKKKDFDRKESLESVYSSNSRLNLLQKRKKLNRLADDMSSNQSLNGKGDRFITQRVLSAKTHRVKQLQNQLADAHYHLQELSNENRMLRATQKKHEIALSRYESSNAELPQVLNAHSEEMRVQIAKYKQLKQQHKETALKLKERELQLQQLKDEHQHLMDLSRDRNLPEREKLYAQLSELTSRAEQQNNTINMLQRKLALEAKNYKYHLQAEINKHRDTRNDLDMAMNNADKLSTIIEMKERLLTGPSCRKSPTKTAQQQRSVRPEQKTNGPNMDGNMLAKFCEESRNLSSALSQEEDAGSSDTRRKSFRSRTGSSRTTPDRTRKNSKESDEIIELAKTVQEGMTDLSIFDEDIDFKNTSHDEVQRKIESMKVDLLKKIKNNEEPGQRMSSALRRYSTESIEESIDEVEEIERPKSRGLRSAGNVSYFGDVGVEETVKTVAISKHGKGDELVPKNSSLEKKLAAKPLDKYCKDIIQGIEKSNKIIEKHVTEFNHSKFESDMLVQRLEAVDKINDFVNQQNEIPEDTLTELNNNFEMLTEQVTESLPVARKRSLTGRKSSGTLRETRSNLFGDAAMTNRDLLEDILGRK